VRGKGKFIFVWSVRRKGHIVHGSFVWSDPVEKGRSDSGKKKVMWKKALKSSWSCKILVQA
jgi:hypothetical protein